MDKTSVIERVEKKWRDILENGKKYKGISPNVDPDTPPVWYDQTKFKRSQQLAYKYYARYYIFIFINTFVIYNECIIDYNIL